MSVIWCHKPIGMTPAECCQKLKQSFYLSQKDSKLSSSEKADPGSLGTQKVGFAARLDPLAYGLLPILTADIGNVETAKLNQTDKTYKFKVIFGFRTDSYDILGIPTKNAIPSSSILKEMITNGEFEQTYPPFSSKTVSSTASLDGSNRKWKPCKIALWELAKNGALPEEMPTKIVKIYDSALLGQKVYTKDAILSKIKLRIGMINEKYDFRQAQIIKSWEKILGDQVFEKIYTASFIATVSSGTYIRSIGNNLGGVCYDICRVGCGNHQLDQDRYTKYEFGIL